VTADAIYRAFYGAYTPFGYDLNVRIIPGVCEHQEVILCCHGTGGDASIAEIIDLQDVVCEHLIGFNFPDYGYVAGPYEPSFAAGSIDELLPAFWVLKKVVVDAGASVVSLYGFSSGGGAVVNLISALNCGKYDDHLLCVGITIEDKRAILQAVRRGTILLDAPMKSLDEVLEFHGINPCCSYDAQRYYRNGMRPIDALAGWEGLNLRVALFFQCPDANLGNRDDQLFIKRLRQVNPRGVNAIVLGNEGGHCAFHPSLWRARADLPGES
jgi:hypothetical protein